MERSKSSINGSMATWIGFVALIGCGKSQPNALKLRQECHTLRQGRIQVTWIYRTTRADEKKKIGSTKKKRKCSSSVEDRISGVVFVGRPSGSEEAELSPSVACPPIVEAASGSPGSIKSKVSDRTYSKGRWPALYEARMPRKMPARNTPGSVQIKISN